MLIGAPGEIGRAVAMTLDQNALDQRNYDLDKENRDLRARIRHNNNTAAGNYRIFEKGIAERDLIIAKQAAELAELRSRVDRLSASSRRGVATIAGYKAWVETVCAMAPDNAALAPSGEKYADGSDISIADQRYGAAFDAKAVEIRAPHLIDERKAANVAA